MNEYRNAYENYYRNINKHSEVKLGNDHNHNMNKGRKNKSRPLNQNKMQKIIFRQICGACTVLLCYGILKYSPLDDTKYIYEKSSNMIKSNVTYDNIIDKIKCINIGGQCLESININGITIDDFKENSIREKVSEGFKYIQSQQDNEAKPI